MLYRRGECKWKLTDFGLYSTLIWEQATQRARTTDYYRAPETLEAPRVPITSKADIWAFGCIVNELVTGKQRHFGEESIFTPDLSKSAPSRYQLQLPTTAEPRVACILTELCRATLQRDDIERPTAPDILKLLQSHSWTHDVTWTSECRHYIGANSVMDAIVARSSSELWSCVRWVSSWYVLNEKSAYLKGQRVQNLKPSCKSWPKR